MKNHRKDNFGRSWYPALKISLIYSLLAVVWLLLSEQASAFLFHGFDNPYYSELLEDGMLVFITAILMFILVERQLSKEHQRQLQIRKYNSTLASLIKHSDFISGDFNAMIETLTRTLSEVLEIERVSI